ncbi:MAG: hypothetical protein GWP10_16400, partial [Nitrospiraceae bacterium]|nr:hypothetical protein [Nitrospiraceae bacterium]
MKMKKLFSSLLVTVFAVAMMASGAWAASTVSDGVTLGNSTTPTVLNDLVTELYASELVNKDDGNAEPIIADSGNGTIAFKLGTNIANNTDITISLTNATFGALTDPGDNFYLAVYDEDTDDNLTTDGTFVSGAGKGGVYSNTVSFTTNTALSKDTIVVLVADDDGNATAGVYGGYKLLCDASLAGSTGDITASVTVSGYPAADGSAKIQSYAPQLALQAYGDATLGHIGDDVIDVAANRLKFVGATLDADNSGIAISKKASDFNGGAVAAGDIAKVTLVIAGNFAGVTDPETDVKFADSDNGFTKTYDAAKGTLTCVTTTAEDITKLIAGEKLTITVDGTTALDTRKFTVTGSVEMKSTDNLNTEFTTDVTWAKWSINGAQIVVPYFNTDTTNYGTYVLFNNISTMAADITGDVYSDGG